MTRARRSFRSHTPRRTPPTAAASSICATAGLLTARTGVFVAALAAFPAGCRAPQPDTKSYTLTGQILAVHPEKQSLTIKHHDIDGYMPAMTMTFAARDGSLVAGRTPGELVKATLEVGDTWSRLTALEVTGKAPITAMPAELALAEGLLKEGDALPEATFVDQDGRTRSLAEWKGAPVAITFTYTRCPLPEFCPRVDRQFVAAQRAI